MEEEGIDGGGGVTAMRVSREAQASEADGRFCGREGGGRRSWSRVGAAPRGPSRSRSRTRSPGDPRRLQSSATNFGSVLLLPVSFLHEIHAKSVQISPESSCHVHLALFLDREGGMAGDSECGELSKTVECQPLDLTPAAVRLYNH